MKEGTVGETDKDCWEMRCTNTSNLESSKSQTFLFARVRERFQFFNLFAARSLLPPFPAGDTDRVQRDLRIQPDEFPQTSHLPGQHAVWIRPSLCGPFRSASSLPLHSMSHPQNGVFEIDASLMNVCLTAYEREKESQGKKKVVCLTWWNHYQRRKHEQRAEWKEVKRQKLNSLLLPFPFLHQRKRKDKRKSNSRTRNKSSTLFQGNKSTSCSLSNAKSHCKLSQRRWESTEKEGEERKKEKERYQHPYASVSECQEKESRGQKKRGNHKEYREVHRKYFSVNWSRWYSSRNTSPSSSSWISSRFSQYLSQTARTSNLSRWCKNVISVHTTITSKNTNEIRNLQLVFIPI